MKRIVLSIGLLCAVAAVLSMVGRGEYIMRNTIFAAELPPIDRLAPAGVETATFALG